jgi:ferredoxin, 2Fe-2S
VPQVTFVHPDGSTSEVNVSPGTTVMRAAISNNVDGIIADCGGSLACATCHVYVDPADVSKFQPVSEEEDEMLDEVVCERRDTSRLSCQLHVADDGDVTVTLPEEQW